MENQTRRTRWEAISKKFIALVVNPESKPQVTTLKKVPRFPTLFGQWVSVSFGVILDISSHMKVPLCRCFIHSFIQKERKKQERKEGRKEGRKIYIILYRNKLNLYLIMFYKIYNWGNIYFIFIF